MKKRRRGILVKEEKINMLKERKKERKKENYEKRKRLQNETKINVL